MHWENPLAQKVLETTESALAADLIREYLEFYRLDYTLSIFLPEANIKQDPMDKSALTKRADLDKPNDKEPLLVQILKERKAGGGPKSSKAPAKQEEVKSVPAPSTQKAKEEPKVDKFGSNSAAAKKEEPKKEQENKNKNAKPIEKPKPSPKGKDIHKKGNLSDYEDDFGDDDIEEMLPVEDIDDHDDNDNKMFTESGGFTGSQSMGMDPSVNTLAMDEYDYIEEVNRIS